MSQFKLIVAIISIGLCQFAQVTPKTPTQQNQRGDLSYLRAFPVSRQSFRLTPFPQLRKTLPPKPNLVQQQKKQIQRREIPFQQPFLGVPVEIENVHHDQSEISPGNFQNVLPRLPMKNPLVKPNETEAERAERIHKSFDRLLTFVEIVGQVDNYVSSKWKNLVKTVSNFYETEDDPYRVNAKRIYGSCPHAH